MVRDGPHLSLIVCAPPQPFAVSEGAPAHALIIFQFDSAQVCELYHACLAMAHAEPHVCLGHLLSARLTPVD